MESVASLKRRSMKTGDQKELYVPERIRKLKDRLLSSIYELDVERVKYYTDAYKRTEGQLPGIRAARGLEETLGKMTIRIDDDRIDRGIKDLEEVGRPGLYRGQHRQPALPLATKFYKSEIPIEEGLSPGICGPQRGFLGRGSQDLGRRIPHHHRGDRALLGG